MKEMSSLRPFAAVCFAASLALASGCGTSNDTSPSGEQGGVGGGDSDAGSDSPAVDCGDTCPCKVDTDCVSGACLDGACLREVRFGPEVDSNFGIEPEEPLPVDVNGDGKLDIAYLGRFWVSANQSYGRVAWNQGTGNGAFGPVVEISSVDKSNCNEVQTGDFNADAKLDIVAQTYGSKATVLVGNGEGVFEESFAASVGSWVRLGVPRDVNADTFLDILWTDYVEDGKVGVLLGQGDGTFKPPLLFSANEYPHGLITGDINGDGKLDIVVGTVYGSRVTVLLGDGVGNFQTMTGVSTASPNAFTIGDFNADGYSDIGVASRDDSCAQVLLGTANGSLKEAATYPLDSKGEGALTADLNGDSRLDMVVSTIKGMVVLVGKGDGTFGSPVPQNVEVIASGVADFNADGKLDLIYPKRTGVGVRLNVSK